MTDEQLRGLAASRAELDRIDDEILNLIERRLAVSAEIAKIKDAEGDRCLKLRPRRQAEILNRLKARAKRTPPALVEQVWREIMAHSLQAQAQTELVLAPAEQPELLEARVRAHFGSAAPIRWAASISHAIRSALAGEVVAIISEPLPDSDGELRVFDVLKSDDGRAVAYAVGRVAADDVAIEQTRAQPLRAKSAVGEWSPEA